MVSSSKKMSGIAGDRTSVVIVRWDNECLVSSSAELRTDLLTNSMLHVSYQWRNEGGKYIPVEWI